MSRTTVVVPTVAAGPRHTVARTSAIASESRARTFGPMEPKVRYGVESDATGPNSALCERRLFDVGARPAAAGEHQHGLDQHPLTLFVGPERPCCGLGKSDGAGMAHYPLSR